MLPRVVLAKRERITSVGAPAFYVLRSRCRRAGVGGFSAERTPVSIHSPSDTRTVLKAETSPATMSYLEQFTRRTPQSEPLPGQVPNSAGGHAWAVDKWARLERFLILGSEGGTYYITEQRLTRDNAQGVIDCIGADGVRTVVTILDVSHAGRAPKNDPAIFALALCAALGDENTRRVALAALPKVCRTGTHLFQFATFVQNFRGWGRLLRRAVADWYNTKEPDALAYQLVKYRQRGGWTHRDLLRLAHPKSASPEHDALYRWATDKPEAQLEPQADIIMAYEMAQAAATPRDTVTVIETHPDVPREALKPEHLTDRNVWDALLRQGMPMTALIRNLATMTRIGLLAPMAEATRLVIEQLGDGERLRKARVHPLAVLVALKSYEAGYSDRSGQNWNPVGQIVDALDGAFYDAFGNVEPTGKRTMLALDVSGSMDFSQIAGMTGITPRVGSAAMALVTASVEPAYSVCAFSTNFIGLPITPRERLDDVLRKVDGLPFGGTDCSLPMMEALRHGMEVDTFIVYTDSETWHGGHPAQALREYREKTGIDAKLAVVGMVSNGFSIADPNDLGMLDVVGFDTAVPQVLSQFSAA